MGKVVATGLVTALVLALPGAALAAGIEVKVAPRQAMVRDSIRVEFHVDTSGRGHFTPPSWDGFKVQSSGTSTQLSIVNGRTSRTVVHTFKVAPLQSGTLTIGSARFRSGSRVFESIPTTVRVFDAPTPTARKGGRLDLGDADIALVAEVTPEVSVPGQQLHLTYTLYSRVGIAEYAMEDPEVTGFWTEDLTSSRQPRFKRRRVGGHDYEAAVIRRFLLFPLKAGVMEVPSVRVEVGVSSGGFFRRVDKRTRRSNLVEVVVKPLPPGAPPGFSGAVGRFELDISADRASVEVGQPVALRAELSGTGNFKHFSLSPPRLPDGFRAYPPTVTDHVSAQRGFLVGGKVLDWIVIPQRPGELHVPVMRVPYYDPEQRRYVTAIGSPVTLKVAAPTSAGAATGAAGAARAGVSPVEATIEAPTLRPLHTTPVLSPGSDRGRQPWQGVPFWLVLLLPPLAGVGLGMSDRVRARRLANRDRHVMRTASKHANRHLKNASGGVRAGRPAEAYADIARGLVGYVDDRTGGRAAGLTIVELGDWLRVSGYDSADIERVIAELENCDHARFAAAGTAGAEVVSAIERVRSLLSDLDRHEPGHPEGRS